MVSKIPTVELQLNANVVNVNDPVELTANLSDLEMEQIEDQGGEIWFVVEGDETTRSPQARPVPRRQPGRRPASPVNTAPRSS